MPHKFRADKNAYRSRKEYERRQKLYDAMDLERINNTLICWTCMKETPIRGGNVFRHHTDCPMYLSSLELLGKKPEDIRTAKPKTLLERPTQKEVEQRRRNVELIAQRRRAGVITDKRDNLGRYTTRTA